MNGFDDRRTGSLLDELNEMEVELARIDDLADSVGKTLTSGFRAALLDGKPLKNLLADIGRSFADIALKAAFKPLGMLVSGAVDTLFATANPALNIFPHAKGGVLSAPTYFPMQGGMGLAGEAGPEAILPLARGADGRLGVAGPTQAPISISMSVQAQDARSFLSAEAEVSAMLLRAVRRGARAS